MSDWIIRLQSIVFTRIKTGFSEKIKNKYEMTNDNFSTTGKILKDADFPFVFVHMLPSIEQGMDLEGTSINAGLFTFQIDITDNQSQTRVQNVMAEIVSIMKEMRFQVTSTPEFESGDTHKGTARFRRMIGNGDVL